jgi:predicted dehydrogenase
VREARIATKTKGLQRRTAEGPLYASVDRHHYPVVARLRETITSGAIGAPVIAVAEAFEPFDPTPDHPRAWLLCKAESGGGP